jgi:UDP-N-acetyl-D-mannosaminuronic acid dehydrogenase
LQLQGFSQVSVIGLGYIGCPTAVVFAGRGINVVGVDLNENTVRSINHGEAHIVEPGLDEIIRAVVASGKLRATTRPEPADAFIVAVPTPFLENHAPDLSHVEAAARSIAPVLAKGNLVVLESTSPVGTTRRLASILAQERPDLRFPLSDTEEVDVLVAYCAERVLPGKILYELTHNDRIIGGLTPACAERASELYKIFVKGACFQTDAATAEMIKLAENAFRDVNIAFANELSTVCESLNIDVWRMIELANLHPRVNILQPGPGVGGHCIAVDPWFIVHSLPARTQLIANARQINDSRPAQIVNQVKAALEKLPGAAIACLGLSFKADIDDLRESPAVKIVHALQQETTADLLIAEPYISELPRLLAGSERARLVEADDAVRRADIILVLVNHKHFYSLGAAELAGKILIDTRGMFRGIFSSETGTGQKWQRSGSASAGAAR